MTTDHTAAFDFYRNLFGWDKQSEMDMGNGLMYLIYGKGEAMYGGMFTRLPEMAGMHPFWLVYIHVKDVGKAVEAAKKAGAFVQRERMEIPGGTIAILGDPQGAGFALHDLQKMPAAAAPSGASTAAKSASRPAKKAAKKTARVAKKAATKSKRVAKKAARKPSRAAKKSTRRAARTTARSKRVAKRPARKRARRTRAKAKK